MRKLIAATLICLIIVTALSGCQGKQPDYIKIIDAYINGFSGLYEQGNEYTELGLQLQADYAYGWAAASVSSMRYCIDCLLYLAGEGDTLEDVVGERPGNWDEIAAMNYASPYPYFFEGLVYNYQGKNEEAKSCYEKALVNPKFSAEHDESLLILTILSVSELKAVKKKLILLEDKILRFTVPSNQDIPAAIYILAISTSGLLPRNALLQMKMITAGHFAIIRPPLRLTPLKAIISWVCFNAYVPGRH